MFLLAGIKLLSPLRSGGPLPAMDPAFLSVLEKLLYTRFPAQPLPAWPEMFRAGSGDLFYVQQAQWPPPLSYSYRHRFPVQLVYMQLYEMVPFSFQK